MRPWVQRLTVNMQCDKHGHIFKQEIHFEHRRGRLSMHCVVFASDDGWRREHAAVAQSGNFVFEVTCDHIANLPESIR